MQYPSSSELLSKIAAIQQLQAKSKLMESLTTSIELLKREMDVIIETNKLGSFLSETTPKQDLTAEIPVSRKLSFRNIKDGIINSIFELSAKDKISGKIYRANDIYKFFKDNDYSYVRTLSGSSQISTGLKRLCENKDYRDPKGRKVCVSWHRGCYAIHLERADFEKLR